MAVDQRGRAASGAGAESVSSLQDRLAASFTPRRLRAARCERPLSLRAYTDGMPSAKLRVSQSMPTNEQAMSAQASTGRFRVA